MAGGVRRITRDFVTAEDTFLAREGAGPADEAFDGLGPDDLGRQRADHILHLLAHVPNAEVTVITREHLGTIGDGLRLWVAPVQLEYLTP